MFKLNYKNKHAVYLAVITIIFLFTTFLYSFASTNINLTIVGCNNNNICESPTETNSSCSNDCNPCNYNNVCETLIGESQTSCSQDCRSVRRSSPYGVGGDTEVPVMAEGKILNLNVKTGINYAIISWDTDVPASGFVSWGLTGNYNDGVVNSMKISKHHELLIDGLSASTTYYYSANASLPDYYFAQSDGVFTTDKIPEIKIVPTVSNFSAKLINGEVVLNWNNPDIENFGGVKIVQSPFFYPKDSSEGKIIYEGSGNYARDFGLVDNQKYYYSAFSYDKDKNYSSGALVEIIFKPTFASSLEKEEILEPQDINNFIFVQDDLELPISFGDVIQVYAQGNFKIITDPNRFKVPIKTIVLRVSDQNNLSRTYSYDFTFDSVKKIFYTTPNFSSNNLFPFSIIAYDFANNPIYVTEGYFNVKGVFESQIQESSKIFSQVIVLYTILGLTTLILAQVLLGGQISSIISLFKAIIARF